MRAQSICARQADPPAGDERWFVESSLTLRAEEHSTELVGKMTGTEIVVTVLGAAIVATAGWLLTQRLRNRAEERRIELENAQRLALSREETRRLEILTQSVSSSSMYRHRGQRSTVAT
jgi:hypothetical protein